jgi:hypothetical protein
VTAVPSWPERRAHDRVKRADVERPGLRLEMRLVDEDGLVLATADEPFELGRFDLAAARQGMRKMLSGLGGIGDSPPT